MTTQSAPGLILGEARAQLLAGTANEAHLSGAAAEQVDAGDWKAAAEAELMLANWLVNYTDRGDQVDAHLALAAEYAGRLPPTEVMCQVAATQAFRLIILGRVREVLELTARMLPIAERVGSSGYASLLQWHGAARAYEGDRGGIEDMQTAADVLAQQAHQSTAHAYANLAEALRSLGDMAAADNTYRTAAEWPPRFGNDVSVGFIAAERAYQAYHAWLGMSPTDS